ncbi:MULTISPECIES: DUF4275 family protein [Parageobacillus]|uniref:DUF4275 family protein n=1 Tax=Parageobacillus TaxID=1906945 RepID=UPI000A56ED77|nr:MULTISPECIES: DUF4275 family protein [Parageobacillus]BDG46827.1 hypothetical protein PspKH34_13880 [Parageobacillus sp. KH3-4]
MMKKRSIAIAKRFFFIALKIFTASFIVFITLENDEFITEEISYEKLPCFEGKTAMRAFHEEN